MITSSKISKRKKRSQRLAFGLFRLTSLLVVAILVWILGFIIVKGAGVVSWEFLTSMPENGMTEGRHPAGLSSARSAWWRAVSPSRFRSA